MALAVQMADQVWNDTQLQAVLQDTDIVNYASRFLDSASIGPKLRSKAEPSWTNFEEKYQRAGEATYELVLQSTDAGF